VNVRAQEVSLRAQLLEDGGDAAATPEFFRCREFMAAEGVTHTLRIGAVEAGGVVLAPLVVREIPAGGFDATSPYGYPGATVPSTARLDPADVDWSGTGLVSIFLRHQLGAAPLSGGTVRGEVQIADPELPRKSRPSDRQQIRRNARRGYEVRRVDGPRASDPERAAFRAVYRQSMLRAGAGRRHFLDERYFAQILANEATWLFLATEPGGEVAAGSIVTRSDAMLHYYLSGTADRFLDDSPMKNLVSAIVDFAEQLGMPLNLGGGKAAGDALEEFKRGFANRTEPFYTSEIVCDGDAYQRLAAGRTVRDFFPAYRAP
jgi:Acetyltransferase (GNAT) domain